MAKPSATTFRGWPPEALEFLRELEENNDRDWFKANRARYDEHLIGPTRALAEELADFGDYHLFRPWNDTRFHHRPPIKEQVGLAIGYGGAGGYYVELSLDGLLVAAGLHMPAPDQLERMRAAIDTPKSATALTRAVKKASDAGLTMGEPELTRAPRGYPIDHPRIDMLRRKRLTVSHRHDLRAWLHKPEAGKRIREGLSAATPLVRWLGDNVGPTQRKQR